MELTQMEKLLITGLHVLDVPTEVITGILSTLKEEELQIDLMDFLAHYHKRLEELSQTDRVAKILGAVTEIIRERSDIS